MQGGGEQWAAHSDTLRKRLLPFGHPKRYPSSCLADGWITDGTLAGHRSQTLANTKTERLGRGLFHLSLKWSGVNWFPGAAAEAAIPFCHTVAVEEEWERSPAAIPKIYTDSCCTCMLCFIDTLLRSYLGSGWSPSVHLQSANSW